MVRVPGSGTVSGEDDELDGGGETTSGGVAGDDGVVAGVGVGVVDEDGVVDGCEVLCSAAGAGLVTGVDDGTVGVSDCSCLPSRGCQ